MRKEIVAEAPTILQYSTRLILSLIKVYQYSIWTRDMKQAFIQSGYSLGRPLFIKPPSVPNVMSMVGHPQDSYLQALKPIYGLKESPGYWWQTYKDYHITNLEMKLSSLDPCLFK